MDKRPPAQTLISDGGGGHNGLSRELGRCGDVCAEIDRRIATTREDSDRRGLQVNGVASSTK